MRACPHPRNAILIALNRAASSYAGAKSHSRMMEDMLALARRRTFQEQFRPGTLSEPLRYVTAGARPRGHARAGVCTHTAFGAEPSGVRPQGRPGSGARRAAALHRAHELLRLPARLHATPRLRGAAGQAGVDRAAGRSRPGCPRACAEADGTGGVGSARRPGARGGGGGAWRVLAGCMRSTGPRTGRRGRRRRCKCTRRRHRRRWCLTGRSRSPGRCVLPTRAVAGHCRRRGPLTLQRARRA